MYPETEITNGVVRARVCLPDAESGFYRGTRFDWSGVIIGLECRGHSYFAPWSERDDPTHHDRIAGPVEEFEPVGDSLGYMQAQAGDTFVRIGVGRVRKPDQEPYQKFRKYELVDAGRWSVRRGVACVEFEHEVVDPSGYAYRYQKTVRLETAAPVLSIAHSLCNTGNRFIETTPYSHNFFVIDGRPTGTEFIVRFAFAVRSLIHIADLAECDGRELRFLREFQRGESVYTDLEGFGYAASDHCISVENRTTGAAVTLRGDRPLSRLVFWSIRRTLCPEPYIHLAIPPSGEASWNTQYEFDSLR